MNKLKVTTISNGEKIVFVTPYLYDEVKKEISYTEENELKTKTRFNYTNLRLIRKNAELTLTYKFDLNRVTEGKIILTDMNSTIVREITTKSIKKDKLNIEIDFQVDGEDIKYKLEVN